MISPENSFNNPDAEAPTLWSPDANSQFLRKDPDAGKDRRQKEKGAAEDEMVGWHHGLSGHEFEQTPGDSGGQRNLACCGMTPCQSMGHRVGHNLATG